MLGLSAGFLESFPPACHRLPPPPHSATIATTTTTTTMHACRHLETAKSMQWTEISSKFLVEPLDFHFGALCLQQQRSTTDWTWLSLTLDALAVPCAEN